MFSLSKILLPIDFSECSRATARQAAALARHFGSEVTLLHVLPDHRKSYAVELGIGLSEDWSEEMKLQARQHLESFLSEEWRQISAKRVLVDGDPALRIVDYAHSQKSDLIMMPTHGYGLFRALLLGSVTSKVLHDAECPVWTGVHLGGEPPVPPAVLKNITCAIDLERHSSNTLQWAGRLASELKAKLTVVHVLTSIDWHTQAYYFTPEWRERMMNQSKADIAALQSRLGIVAELILKTGRIAESVCAAAEHSNADLLIVGRGSASDGGAGRFRTNAYGIIRRSHCPVVSV